MYSTPFLATVDCGVLLGQFIPGKMSPFIANMKPLIPNCSAVTENMASAFEEMVKNASSPKLVAKVVLEAVTNQNPNFRYLAGKDVEHGWMLKEKCLMKSSTK